MSLSQTKCRAPGCRAPAVFRFGLYGSCSIEHGAVIAEMASAKLRAKAEREAKRVAVAQRKADRAKLKAMRPLRDFVAETQEACNRYVRLRDAALPCISCQRHHGGKWNAGHYRSTGAAPEMRFNLDNLHKQCEPCNTHLSGNLLEYRKGLLERIGPERLAALEGPHPTRKWTREDLIALRAKFNAMAKELE